MRIARGASAWKPLAAELLLEVSDPGLLQVFGVVCLICLLGLEYKRVVG